LFVGMLAVWATARYGNRRQRTFSHDRASPSYHTFLLHSMLSSFQASALASPIFNTVIDPRRLHDPEEGQSSHPLQVFLVQNFHHLASPISSWTTPFDSNTDGPTARLPQRALAS
jgi:hypothetical protein